MPADGAPAAGVHAFARLSVCDYRLELATGIEFIEVDQRDSVILHGYVYERLINE